MKQSFQRIVFHSILFLLSTAYHNHFVGSSCLGQEETTKAPYSEPPKLELKFQDDFAKDSRGDYIISGKKNAVSWEKGKLTLGDEAILQRELNAGSWVEMELDLVFPKLSKDGQTSEIKIWLDLEGATDSFVWFRQKHESGKTRSAIFIVDTSAKWNQQSKTQPVTKPLIINGPLANGNWLIKYRQGLWTVTNKREELAVYGYIENREAIAARLVLQSFDRDTQVHLLRSNQSNRVIFNPTPEIAAKIEEADSLNSKVVRLFHSGKPSQAILVAENIAKIRQSLLGNFHPDYAASLNSLGILHKRMGSYKKAELLYIEAKDIRKKILGKLHPDYASSLSNLAVLYFSISSFKKAESLFNEVRIIREKVLGKTHPDYADILSNLGTLYDEMGLYDKAEPLLSGVLDIRKTVLGTDHPDYATSLNNLASLYVSLGSYDKAEPLLVEARDVFENVLGKKHPNYAASLNNLAVLYEFQGSYEKAEPLLIEACDIREKVLGKKHPGYASSLINLASLYDLIGSYEKAEPLFIEARDINVKAKGKLHPDYGIAVSNLALLYASMGLYAKAEPLLIETLDINEKVLGKNHPDFATSLNNLAFIYEHLGANEKAERLFIEARDICEKAIGKNRPAYAASLNNLALFYQSRGLHRKAAPLLIEASDINEKVLGNLHPKYATGLHNLAFLYESLGSYEKAEPLFVEARAIQEKVLGRQHPDYAASLNNLAKLYMLMGSYAKAEPLYQISLSISRNNLDRYSLIQSESQRQQFAKSFEHKFSASVSNALKMERRGRSIWEQAILWKGISLIRQKRNLALASLPETKATFEELKSIRSQMSKQLRSDPAAKGWKSRNKELKQNEELAEKKLARLIAALNLGVVDSVQQEVAIPSNACLVDFRRFDHIEPDHRNPGTFKSDPHYLTLIRKPDNSVEMLDLGSAETIEKAISSWRGPIEAVNRNNRFIDTVGQQAMDRAGQELRKLLWEPLEKHIGDSELVIVSPDGALGRLPLIALPGKKPGTYLLEEKKIVYLPVPALLPQMLGDPAKAIGQSSKALLIGNIEYGSRPKREGADLLHFRNRRILKELQFNSLANTGKEINGINKLFYNATRLTENDATENAFQQKLKDHSVLHIATHGFFRSPDRFMKNLPRENKESLVMMREQAKVLTENPNLLSGLALADANAAASKQIADAQNDGILYSAEIAMLPMEHVELAVLSACETSLGTDDNPGEGLIGIQRAFQVAGVKSTVASYWKVNDEATQMLMNKFYENLIEYSKKAKASGSDLNSTTIRIDALRDAQLWMLRDLKPEQMAKLTRGVDDKVPSNDLQSRNPKVQPRTKSNETSAHPRYWAAFVLSGDWR